MVAEYIFERELSASDLHEVGPTWHRGEDAASAQAGPEDATCRVSTGGGTRRVQLVREGGGGGGGGHDGTARSGLAGIAASGGRER